ncbi:MAG: tRNA lysidine(34) synthetase TilS [Bacteroidota bacterium]|nr:tRNA lysidine(34) synthetase TilS [Bacteroidota bacterium]
MLERFTKHIKSRHLFEKGHKLLVAISGGPDSVALTHLLKVAGFSFELVHCNFKLRGRDSNADEKFCKTLAKQLDINIYVESFETKQYANKNKLSTQMAARELRYNLFEKLMLDGKFDYLLTAHHANDTVETVLINLLRGTGIKGLTGIPEKNGKIIRPLLIFTRDEIDAYLKQNRFKFRVDKSNLEDKYERNFLRLNVVPALKKLNPSIEFTFIKNGSIFKEESEIIKDFLEDKNKFLLKKESGSYLITKSKVRNEKHQFSILYYILKPFNFSATQTDNIIENVNKDGLVGKVFKSKTHTLTIDRTEILIKEIKKIKAGSIKINSLQELSNIKLLKVKKTKNFNFSKPKNLPKQNELIINEERLIFPLTIRTKIEGDKFKPFGMKGFKLVSDFFKEKKMNLFEKENCKLLVNGNGEIIWIIGYRSDERYRVTNNSEAILKLTVID